jgi:phage terminase large subunit-like protein
LLVAAEVARQRIEQLDAEAKLRTYFAGGLSPRPGSLRFGVASPKIVAFHADNRAGRILKGGNKSAKTVAGAVDVVLRATGHHPWRPWRGPEAIRCVAPELPLSLDIPHPQRDTVLEWCPKHWLRGGTVDSAYSVTGHVLHFETGSFLEFLSFEQDPQVHAQERRTVCWFDEEPPKVIHQENMARLARGRLLGDWVMTYVPVAGLVWIHDELYRPALEGRRHDVGVHEVTIWDNQHNLPAGFIEQLATGMDPEVQKVRLYGQYGVREGLVFGVFGRNHMVDQQFTVTAE